MIGYRLRVYAEAIAKGAPAGTVTAANEGRSFPAGIGWNRKLQSYPIIGVRLFYFIFNYLRSGR